MTIETGRQAIETYWKANWTATPTIGYGGLPSAVTTDCVRLTIRHGRALTRSLSRAGGTQNLIAYICTLTAQIFTDGAAGDVVPNGYAETILGLFHSKTLDAAGALITSPAQVPLVRFSPPELAGSENPYIGAQIESPPYRQTNVIIPFIRYEVR